MRKQTTLRKVFSYIGHYRLYMVLSLICAAVSVVLMLYNPILIGRAVDLIAGQGRVEFEVLLTILIRMAVITVLSSLAQLMMNTCNNRISFAVVKELRRDAFRHLQVMPLSYLDSHPHGETLSRIITDVDQFSDGLLLGFSQLFTGVLTIIGTLGFMFSLNVWVSLAVVVLTPLSLVVASFIAKRTYDMFHRQSRTRGEQTALIDEMIGNLKIVKAFGHEKKGQETFDEINDRLQKYSLQATFFSSLTNPCTRFVNSVVYAAVGVLGACLAITGRLSVGNLVSFLSYANQYTKPFNEISGVMTEFQNALACAARVFDLIEEKEESPDTADTGVLLSPDGRADIRDVSFSYRGDVSLIEHLNLQVEKGQRIAIVGPTGCGKTTIINLLMRFYDVNEGSICLGGMLKDGNSSDLHDIRTLTRQSLRASYGMVLQETWLKSGTIRDNIRLAMPEATEEQITEAARLSHAHSFIRRLPAGYDTVLTEDGGGLSQGQKQLLCITRVMLALPPMLILDEATSSIDVRTEQRIQKAFQTLMEGRTSFIVAHRLSTIRNADIILVMRDGHIVEQGTHSDLMNRDGFYAKLYRSQFAAGSGTEMTG